MSGLGTLERPPVAQEGEGEAFEPQPVDEGRACIDRRAGFVACRHFDRADFSPGARVQGPALIHQLDSTVLVMPGHWARALVGGALSITPSAEATR